MFCKSCGADLLETAKFCPNCGCKVEVEVAPVDTSVAENVENVVEEVVETTEEVVVDAEPVVETIAEPVIADAVITDVEEATQEVVEIAETVPVIDVAPVAEVIEEVPVDVAEVAETVVESPVTDIKDETNAVVASSIASAVVDEPVISNFQEAPMSENVTTEVKNEVKNEVKPSRKAIKDKKNYEKNAKKQAVIDSLPAEYKPVAVSTYFWLTVLAAIPVVGFIFSIILSFTGKNRNRKNFMKAIFVWYIIGIILALVAALVVTFAFPDAMTMIFDGVADLLIDLGLA